MITVTQYAVRNGISRQAVLKRIATGKLRAQKVGNYYLIDSQCILIECLWYLGRKFAQTMKRKLWRPFGKTSTRRNPTGN